MARRRMIDPRFWADEKIIELSILARLMFIGIWNFSDDEGIHQNSTKSLKAEIFPCDEITTTEIEEAKQELINYQLIVVSNCNNFFKVKNWKTYQHISRPTPSNYQKIKFIEKNSDDIHGGLTEDSLSTHGGLTEDSLSTHAQVKLSQEKLREDSISKDKLSQSNSTEPDVYSSLVNFWNSLQGGIPCQRASIEELGAINRRKNDNTIDQIKTTINNYAIIRNSDQYRYNYRHTFADFLNKKYDYFSDLKTAQENELINDRDRPEPKPPEKTEAEKQHDKYIHDLWLHCPTDDVNRIIAEDDPVKKEKLRQEIEQKLIANDEKKRGVK